MSVISEILTGTRRRLEERKLRRPLDLVRTAAADGPRARASLHAELLKAPFSVIAEIKSRSPSMGPMGPANVTRALEVYADTPAVSAISILTNEDHFGNSLADLEAARKRTDKPILRKDFIVDEYQVWEARAAGADAILLMAGVLADPVLIRRLFDLATSLQMDVLFEIGMGEIPVDTQVGIVPAEAPIWGVNSRQFKSSKLQLRARVGRLLGRDFWTSGSRHHDLIDSIPTGKTIIAESGIHEPTGLSELARLGYRAALIGTAFLKNGVEVDQVVAKFAAEVARMNGTAQAFAAARATG